MPPAPRRPCRKPGCDQLHRNESGFCDAHEQQVKRKAQREHDARRGSAASRGYDSKWRQARAAYLRKHPLCIQCQAEGRAVAATVVDHIEPHRGDKALFWDSKNWQPLCKRHHDIKTANEDGGGWQ
ncbi:MAG: HNH endonuclease signature motif containing protein [Desulfovibrionaceae bacterium]